MNFLALEDNLTGKQIFLASLLSNETIRLILDGCINGGYSWEYEAKEGSEPGVFGTLHIASEFIRCLAESSGGNLVRLNYRDAETFARDVNLLFILQIFWDVEAAASEEGDAPGREDAEEGESDGEEWRD